MLVVKPWHLVLKRDSGDTVIESFSTKRQAIEELSNRKNLCDVLKVDFSKTYYISEIFYNERKVGNADKRLG
jgi:hypothetical protein